MGKQCIGISFWDSDALVGGPPNPRSDALHPIEHVWRRGFMLRMTSRGRLALQRRGDSRFSGARGQPLERSRATQAATRAATSQSAIHTQSQTMYRSALFFADALNGSRCWYHSPPGKGHTRRSWPFVCSRPGSSEPSSQVMPFLYIGATITRIKGTQPGR